MTHRPSGGLPARPVRHKIKIPGLSHPADCFAIDTALAKLPGILELECRIRQKCILVEYDQHRLQLYVLLNRLANTGFPASRSWWSRQTHQLFNYLDLRAALSSTNNPASMKQEQSRVVIADQQIIQRLDRPRENPNTEANR